MTVDLPPHLAGFVRERIESGEYGSADEVIGEALVLLARRDGLRRERIAQLRSELEEGLKEAYRGETVGADDVFAACHRLVASSAEADR